MIAGDPRLGGATWAVLQYLLGFRRLGDDVLLVEPIKPASLRPAGAKLAESANAEYFPFFITDRCPCVSTHSARTHLMSAEQSETILPHRRS